MKVVLDGMGSKISQIISSLACFVTAYIVGLILCWDLTLILLATFPLMMLCGIFMTKVRQWVPDFLKIESVFFKG